MDEASRTDETNQHHLDTGLHLMHFFCLMVTLDASTDLTAASFQGHSHSTSFPHQ